MLRRGMVITLAGYELEMGRGAMYLGWAGWGAERAHGIFLTFPLF